MFNKKEKDMTNKKVWLVIEKTTYGDDSSFTVAKYHVELKEAMTYKIYLEKLNDRSNRRYFLASDTETVMNTVATAHNKSVENGTYYDNHPEVKRPDIKKAEVVDDTF